MLDVYKKEHNDFLEQYAKDIKEPVLADLQMLKGLTESYDVWLTEERSKAKTDNKKDLLKAIDKTRRDEIKLAKRKLTDKETVEIRYKKTDNGNQGR